MTWRNETSPALSQIAAAGPAPSLFVVAATRLRIELARREERKTSMSILGVTPQTLLPGTYGGNQRAIAHATAIVFVYWVSQGISKGTHSESRRVPHSSGTSDCGDGYIINAWPRKRTPQRERNPMHIGRGHVFYKKPTLDVRRPNLGRSKPPGEDRGLRFSAWCPKQTLPTFPLTGEPSRPFPSGGRFYRVNIGD